MTDRVATGGEQRDSYLGRELSLWGRPSSWLKVGGGKLAATGWIRAFNTSDRDAPVIRGDTGHGRGVIAVAHGGVWVANRASRTVARLDPRTLELSALQKFRKPPVAIAAGPNAVWAVGSNGWLWRIWPDAQQAEGVARLGRGATAIAAAGELIWVLRWDGNLYGLEIASGDVATEGRVPRGAGHMVAHDDALWVSCGRNRHLVQIDPHSGRLGLDVKLPHRVGCLTVAGDALLAGCVRRLSPKRGWLHTIDPFTQQVASTAELPSRPRAIAFDGDAAWVACGNGRSREGTIERVELGSGAATTWWRTKWAVGDLALLDDTLLVSMSLELPLPVAYGAVADGGGAGGGCGGDGGGGGGNC